ncbi:MULTISPECIES: hypothetical protein [unclassified Chryseobacterium]|uniref:hypothetical protein n=1 Tax=unclassified Chryseobacterium TaxID=2593645 RepID=UPI0030178A24
MKAIILFISVVVSFCEVNAQVADTLIYLKHFEMNRINYIGQPFSKLLNDMNILNPKRLYTQNNGCNHSTQFWFVDTEKPFNSHYKMNIVWENNSIFKGEEMKNGFYNINSVENEYKKYVIKKLEISDGGLNISVNHYFSNKLNPSTFINSYLIENKSTIVNTSFFYFLCFLRTASMKIITVKNICISPKKDVLQTIFTVVNPNNRKKTKVIITWDSPISNYQIKDYINRNGKHFNNDKRNLYVDKTVKDIFLYKRH